MENNEQKVISISSVKNEKNKMLTDKEITSLFLGLVKLIKKNAMLEVEEDLKKDCFEANKNFRQSLIDLNKTESLLKKEQEKNLVLQSKLNDEQKKYCLLVSKTMEEEKT